MTITQLYNRITSTSISKFLFLFIFIFSVVNINAQTGLNFQGVARNSNNVILASQQISLRLSILQGTATGVAEYTETRTVTTNAQGLFTAVIGDAGATSTLGNFTTINWKNTPKYLKVEMDVAAGTNFTTMGTTQFQYVAYAQFANGVDAANIAGIVPVEKGGTGVASITALKTALAIDKTTVGLSNVDNTTDLLKPISTATQTALNLKANNENVTTSLSLKLNKTDTSNLLQKADTITLSNRIDSKVDKLVGKELSTNDYTTTEKTKLAAIAGTNTGDQDLSSYATNTALALKANTSDINTSLGLKASVTNVTTSLALKEDASNKSAAADLGGVSPSDALFPTQKAVKDYVTANASVVADVSITTIKLADGAVTDAKLGSGISKSKIGLGNVENTALSTWNGNTNISSLGIIETGTWSGTAISVAHGGTSTNILALNNVLLGNGTSAFKTVAPGTNGNVLTSNGTTWTSAAPSGGATTHSLGEAFGGGIVFYVTSDGLHGLIGETQNLSSKCFWMDAQNEISKSSNHSTAGKLFSDWRLPTANELDLLLTYSNATGLVPGLNTWYYWSSTEGSSSVVHIEGYPSLDKTSYGLKYVTDLYEVRPIRSF